MQNICLWKCFDFFRIAGLASPHKEFCLLILEDLLLFCKNIANSFCTYSLKFGSKRREPPNFRQLVQNEFAIFAQNNYKSIICAHDSVCGNARPALVKKSIHPSCYAYTQPVFCWDQKKGLGFVGRFRVVLVKMFQQKSFFFEWRSYLFGLFWIASHCCWPFEFKQC